MRKEVKIYGASDDLIEVCGDLNKEFSGGQGWRFLHFNEGTIVKVGYDMRDAPRTETGQRKEWHIEVLRLGDGTDAQQLMPKLDRGRHYSDHLRLEGELNHVRCTSSPNGITHDELLHFFNEADFRDYGKESLYAAYKILNEPTWDGPNESSDE